MSKLTGRKQRRVNALSAANTEKENSISAPDVGHSMIVTSYFAVITAAAAGSDVLVTIEDEDDTVLWSDNFGATAARGTRLGIVFGFDAGIPVTAGKGVKIVTAAGGASCVIRSGMTVEEY